MSFSKELEKNRFYFIGQERDRGTGLMYFGARYLDPGVGRCISVDPLANIYHNDSPYNYCENNPINKFDKDGKASAWAVAGIGAVIGAAGGFILEVCHQSVLSSNPGHKFDWNAVGKATGLSALKDFYVGSVIGLVSGDITALLTYKSIFLTSSVVVSGGAIKGTVQGILDNNDLNDNKENEYQKTTNPQVINNTEDKNDQDEEKSNHDNPNK